MSQILALIESNNIEDQDKKTLIEKFEDYEQTSKEWETKARAIVVTSVDQKTEMAMAKEARKKFTAMRIEIEKTRKALKEQSLRKGQAIDAIARYLTSLVSPIEEYLESQEKFAEIKAEEERQRLILEAQKAAEAQAEAERLAKEKAEAEERARIKAENERLRAEAQAREAEIAKERAEAQLKLDKERKVREALEEEKARADALIEEEKAKKLKEEKELADAQRTEQYEKWLAKNNYNPETMKVEKTGNIYKIWVCVDKLELN